MYRIPTKQDAEASARRRRKAIRKEMSKPIEQNQQGLLSVMEFLDSLDKAYHRGCEQD